MIIKRVDAISVGKISGIVAAAIGLLAGVIFLLFGSMFSTLLGAGGSGGTGAAMAGGVMGMLLLPLLYGVLGFIGGLVYAWIYNVAARFVGGIRIETD